MTLKIESHSEGSDTTIRLIGRMQEEHLDELKAQIEKGRPKIALDLEQLSLVDVKTVRFFALCETEGILIVRCSPYIRDWIDKEAHPPDKFGGERF
jgi:pyruvate/2-oxoglutarate/acetoin dehydrogenase E1 component